jgi:hypothetical protein
MRCFNVSVAILLAIIAALVGCSGSTVENAEFSNTFELMTAAARAHAAGQIEDAGFLFIAGQMRFQIDRQVYPPAKTGGDSPGVLTAALSASVGDAIIKTLATNPNAFVNVTSRLSKWSPKFEEGYKPGWEYTSALGKAAIAPVVAATQKEVLAALQAKSQLYGNAEYLQRADEVATAVAVEQKYWRAFEEKKNLKLLPEELKKEYEAATKKKLAAATRMKEIEWATNPTSRWHARIGWKAENYFEDARVIALCRSIEQNDIPEMERLIAAGANVNAVGKDGMTLLMWAFPERKLERFESLLKHGADPNIVIQSDFGTRHQPFHPYPTGGAVVEDRGCHAGQSVTLLAARSPVIEYLKMVLEHDGNANQIDGGTGESPLDVALDRHLSDGAQRVDMLIAKGADPNRYCKYKLAFPAMQAVTNNRFDIALALLKAGADPKLEQPDGLRKLIHFVARSDRDLQYFQPNVAAAYKELVEWLRQNGETLEQARQDEANWANRYKGAIGPEGFGATTRQLIQERKQQQRAKATQD